MFMELTEVRREAVRPAMEEFERGQIHSTYTFDYIHLVTNLREEIGQKRNFCNSCGGDKYNYYLEIYNQWKQ